MKPTLIAILGIIGIAAVITLLGTGIYIENSYGGSWDTFWYGRKGECNLELPWNLKVVWNEKVYAIQTLLKNGTHEYLWQRSTGEIDMLLSVSTTFPDSCKAKSFAFQFVKQQKEQMQADALKAKEKPFTEVKPPKLQTKFELKAHDYSTTVYINYPNNDTIKTLEEQQLLDSAVKELQAKGGGIINVTRTRQGFWVNAQTWDEANKK